MPEHDNKSDSNQDHKANNTFNTVKRLWVNIKQTIDNAAKNIKSVPVKNVYKFAQTPLGSTLIGAAVGSGFTYIFSRTKLSEERDQAVENLKISDDENKRLNDRIVLLTDRAEKLTDQAQSESKKAVECKIDLNICNADINSVKTLYNNISFFHKKICPDVLQIHNNNFATLNKYRKEEKTLIPQPK